MRNVRRRRSARPSRRRRHSRPAGSRTGARPRSRSLPACAHRRAARSGRCAPRDRIRPRMDRLRSCRVTRLWVRRFTSTPGGGDIVTYRQRANKQVCNPRSSTRQSFVRPSISRSTHARCESPHHARANPRDANLHHPPLREDRAASPAITLNRPERGNGITFAMPRELAAAWNRPTSIPQIHVIALVRRRQGLLRRLRPGRLGRAAHARRRWRSRLQAKPRRPARRSIRRCKRPTTTPTAPGIPMVDYAMMSRNVRGFMSLFHSDKPVVCKVHGFCVAGGTDMALCSDLLVIEDDGEDRLPAGSRVGRADHGAVGPSHRCAAGQAAALHRRLPVGQPRRSSGAWRSRRRRWPSSTSGSRVLLGRIAQMPVNQLIMMKLLVNQTLPGLAAHANPGHRLRRHRSPHGRRLRLSAPRRRGRFQASRPRARRAVRRFRSLDVQGLTTMHGQW